MSSSNPMENLSFLRITKKLLRLVVAVLENHPRKEELLDVFLLGIFLAEYDRRSGSNHSTIIKSLTKPFFDLIDAHISSKEYKRLLIDHQIDGDEIIEIETRKSPSVKVKIPLTQDKLLNQIKKKDALALVPADIKPVLQGMIDEYVNRYTPINNPKPNPDQNQQLISFEDLFRDPDAKKHAEKVKEIVGKMNLTSPDGTKVYTNRLGDKSPIRKNSLAYVFAALRDPDNRIRVIRNNGAVADKLSRFYREFNLVVAEKREKGDVTRRNLLAVLKNPQRSENSIYKEFTLIYKESTLFFIK